MRDSLTASEIADALGNGDRAVRKRAKKDKWSFLTSKSESGQIQKLFTFEHLPEDVRVAVMIWYQKQTQVAPVEEPSMLPAKQRMTIDPASLPQAKIDKAMAKADLLRLYLAAMKRPCWGSKKKARDCFMEAYNSGLAYSKLFDALGPVNWKTIDGWMRKVNSAGMETMALADTRGRARLGQRTLSKVQTDILLKCVLHPNKPTISAAIRMANAVMETKNIGAWASEATYRRWLQDWISTNHHIWTFNRKGAKAWNDECAYYIERDYNLINVGDILVADGHVLNFDILDPWIGKPRRMTLILWYDMKSNYPMGWEIMPTENTQAIASALRRAILRLGKYPKIAYLDNGRAFKSKFFNGVDFDQDGFAGLFDRLGIGTIFAWPYHGQSKTVERFFGTTGEFERWVPTYVGNNIENKPARMMRGERLHRKAYAKVMGDGCITMEQAHIAIAAWFDEYTARPQKGHLDGQPPNDLYLAERGPGVDPVELRYLMMSMEIKHIHQNGIRVFGKNYYNPALYGRRHPVLIRYDLQDKSALYVFTPDGEFLCEATPVDKVHPAATILGTDADRKKLTEHIELKKHQEKEASRLARDFLEETVLPEHRRQLAAAGIEMIQPAGKVLALPAPAKPAAMTASEEKKILAELEELQAMNCKLPDEKKEEEYIPERVDDTALEWAKLSGIKDMDRMYKLIEFEVRGWMIPKQWQAFMKFYEQTAEYTRYADHFEMHRAQMVVEYQVASAR